MAGRSGNAARQRDNACTKKDGFARAKGGKQRIMHFSEDPKSKKAFHTNRWEITLIPTQTPHKEENRLRLRQVMAWMPSGDAETLLSLCFMQKAFWKRRS